MDNDIICKDCALRLYNTKSYNLQGVGNPFYGNCIVVPNVDYKAYKNKSMDFSTQVEIIKQVIIPSTGVEESNFYIVPLIRCNESISCDLDKLTFDKCIRWFANDVRKYQFNNVLLLGNAARRFLNINIKDYLDTILLSKKGIRYFVNYSPFVKNIDEKLFDTFKEYLIKWYNSITSGMYDYNLKML
jgi:hypothetical protein